MTIPPLVRIQRAALILGLIGLVASVAGLFLTGPAQFFQSYLFAFVFWLGLSIGGLVYTLMYYVVHGRWGLLVRRTTEAASRVILLMAVLFIPLLFGLSYLYPWARPELVAADPILQHKAAYLNTPFFIVRAVIYFAIWIFLSFWLGRLSNNLASKGDAVARPRLQAFGAIGLVVIAFSMTLAAVDWLMSLQPHWYSTAYGLIIIAGQSLGAFAFALVVLPLLIREPPTSRLAVGGYSATWPKWVRDVAVLLLTNVLLWAYMSYFQFLINWGGNTPTENNWYFIRSHDGWLVVSILVYVLQFALPFAVLISLAAKRNLRIVSGLSLIVLLGNLIYFFWEVKPSFSPNAFALSWLDFALPIGLGGLWLAAWAWFWPRTSVQVITEPAEGEPQPSQPEQAGAR